MCNDLSHYPLSVYSNFLSACFNLWIHVHKTYLEFSHSLAQNSLKTQVFLTLCTFVVLILSLIFLINLMIYPFNTYAFKYKYKSAVQLSCYIDLLGSGLFLFDLTLVISSFIILSGIYSCFARYLRTSSGYVNSFFTIGIWYYNFPLSIPSPVYVVMSIFGFYMLLCWPLIIQWHTVDS